MANDFLFELGCEELPSGSVSVLAEALASNLTAAFNKAQISYGELRTFATPRRLGIYIKDLAEKQPGQTQIRRGPSLIAAYDSQGQPTPALLGFAKSCNVAPEELTRSKSDKGDWLVHQVSTQGANTAELLGDILNQALATLPIVRQMRWGTGEFEFVRPVHWALLLLDENLIDAEILGVKTNRYSYGHRFHHPQAIEISKAEHYESLLKEAFVIANFKERRALIVEQVEQLASQKEANAIMPEALIDEVTSIVEWPQALTANFEESFLSVPAEALIASMQSHQKCFALQNNKGQLLAHFITVANINSSNSQQVIAGNEKVMRARLSDAAFFFNLDKKQPLTSYLDATEKVVFQVKLGSLKEKTNRLQSLMELLAEALDVDKEQAGRAALLSKCDLLTGMVGEFPELQGLMGYYYALNDGEAKSVALALNEQYMPRFAADKLPETNLGLALSLSDRLDTLVGIFAIGQKPSGVKDPFKLRRHALAVVRLLLASPKPLYLSKLIAETHKIYSEKLGLQTEPLVAELKPFILDRMQSYYQGIGFGTDLVSAVKARQDDCLYDFDKRIHALSSFVKLSEATALSAACKRVNNILQQAEKFVETDQIDENLLQEGSEKALFTHLHAIEQLIKPLYEKGDYEKILSQLASLREPVDAFFENVMVMIDNHSVKKNRLLLLARLQSLLQGVADISKITS
ncbi:MAG: glycine--tRNA ligase subunit beta [Tatlockia sp.]|nr:glycine--tRNA ligase subunit beta [Tatlockia sp.]